MSFAIPSRAGSRASAKWESWKRDRARPDLEQEHWLAVAGRKMLHPTRLAFEGVGLLALAAAALAAAYAWRAKTPEWYLMLGFALLRALGAAATFALHRAFNQAS